MFIKLIKRLFTSSSANKQPDYTAFEKNRGNNTTQDNITQENKQTLTAEQLMDAETRHLHNFYQFLFGKSDTTAEQDELSIHIANKIERLLADPKHILASLPVLPVSITKVLNQANDEAFDADELISLIQGEPVIAAKVLELANSQFYNPSGREILDLKSAFMRLGATGLVEGVINGFLSKLTPQSQVYFKQYGNKIWQHSADTGDIAKRLLLSSQYKEEANQAYLIGLICNLGDMIMFQLLMDAFSYVHPDCEPNSHAFKLLMVRKSKTLTYFIAKHWQFPKPILDALAIQAKIQKTSLLNTAFSRYPLACYVYEANIISELFMMLETEQIKEVDLEDAKVNLVVSDTAKALIQERILTTI